MIALTRSEERRQWTFENQWYNIPLNKIADTPWLRAKYILLHLEDEEYAGNLCEIVKYSNDVWTKDKLKRNNYPGEPNNPTYFMIRINKPSETDSALRNLKFKAKNVRPIFWARKKSPFILVKLKDLETQE